VEVTGRPYGSANAGRAVEELSVPYFGLVARMRDMPGWSPLLLCLLFCLVS
jgi:hypothetical protein